MLRAGSSCRWFGVTHPGRRSCAGGQRQRQPHPIFPGEHACMGCFTLLPLCVSLWVSCERGLQAGCVLRAGGGSGTHVGQGESVFCCHHQPPLHQPLLPSSGAGHPQPHRRAAQHHQRCAGARACCACYVLDWPLPPVVPAACWTGSCCLLVPHLHFLVSRAAAPRGTLRRTGSPCCPTVLQCRSASLPSTCCTATAIACCSCRWRSGGSSCLR